jgi:RNA polymerase sigma-70 factor (ECF subfamily)
MSVALALVEDKIPTGPQRMKEGDASAQSRFDADILPHVRAGYNLARWLTRNDADAEDVVQEAALRAWRFFDSFRGGNARAWFLTIVRRTGMTWLTRRGAERNADEFDEALHTDRDDAPDPERLAIERAGVERIRGALETLPAPLREIVVLREQEGLSYKEIATIAGIPIGTVMSRLARGRSRLLAALSEERKP